MFLFLFLLGLLSKCRNVYFHTGVVLFVQRLGVLESLFHLNRAISCRMPDEVYIYMSFERIIMI